MSSLLAMLLVAQPAPPPALSDEQVYTRASRDFLLDSHARHALFDNASVRARFRGEDFMPSCAAFFRAVRAQKGRYDVRFRPTVVRVVRDIVPGPTLAAATSRPMFAGGSMIPFEGRVRARVEVEAAPLLAEAARDMRIAFAAERARTGSIRGVSPMPWREDNPSSLTLACAIWAGENQATIFGPTKGTR